MKYQACFLSHRAGGENSAFVNGRKNKITHSLLAEHNIIKDVPCFSIRALCGMLPGSRSYMGWQPSDNQINCPRCLKRMEMEATV